MTAESYADRVGRGTAAGFVFMDWAVIALLALYRPWWHPVLRALLVTGPVLPFGRAVRMRVVADASGLRIHNFLSTHEVPWSEIRGFERVRSKFAGGSRRFPATYYHPQVVTATRRVTMQAVTVAVHYPPRRRRREAWYELPFAGVVARWERERLRR